MNSILLKTDDEYLYYTTDQCKRRGESVYRCRHYDHKSLHCPARLILKDGVYRNSSVAHNHENEEDIEHIEFTNECCRRVREQRGQLLVPGGLKLMFEQVKKERPKVNIKYRGALQKRMQRIQKKNKELRTRNNRVVPIPAAVVLQNEEQPAPAPAPAPAPIPSCPVCLSNPINRLLIPCGHTLCHECTLQLDKTPQFPCPVCRKPSAAVNQLFFP